MTTSDKLYEGLLLIYFSYIKFNFGVNIFLSFNFDGESKKKFGRAKSSVFKMKERRVYSKIIFKFPSTF